MVVFPNCKINIGLHVVGKRPDGYHNIETVFYPVNWCDALEVITRTDSTPPQPKISVSGIQVDGAAENNICFKAWQLLKKDFPQLPVVDIHLHKAIPIGAGLGGGSADGAYMLQLLNNKFQLNLSTEQLLQYSIQLGSDCPVFILNEPCYATGRGEELKRVSADLSGYSLLIIHPGIHINTGWAFSKITPRASGYDLQEAITLPVEQWKETISNDFETPVFEAHPSIAAIKDQLYGSGAIYASMSGSGSSVFGIFPQHQKLDLDFPKTYVQQYLTPGA